MPNFPQDSMNKLALPKKKKKKKSINSVYTATQKPAGWGAGQGRTAHLSGATVTPCGHILLKYLKVCAHFSSETKVCGWESSKEN